jgi:hypothetical protein
MRPDERTLFGKKVAAEVRCRAAGECRFLLRGTLKVNLHVPVVVAGHRLNVHIGAILAGTSGGRAKDPLSYA